MAKIIPFPALAGAADPQALFKEMLENDSIKAAVVFWIDENGYVRGRQAGLEAGDMARIALVAGNWALHPDED